MYSVKNPFFRALPDFVRRQLASSISLIELPRGAVIQSLDGDPRIYFPATVVFSISAHIQNVPRTFMRFAGGNLAVGLGKVLGADALVYQAKVVGGGYAYVIPENQLLRLFSSEHSVGEWQRQAALSASEMALIAGACAGVHTTSQRLARLLLQAGDAFGVGRPITLTQAELAHLLGVTRESIVILLKQWCRAGLLTHRRGQIAIEARERVFDMSCQCYAAAQELEARALKMWAGINWREIFEPELRDARANGAGAYPAIRRVE